MNIPRGEERMERREQDARPHAYAILMVCSGNICRSPTAEAVLRRMAQDAGLEARLHIDSAGTHGLHAGEPPDARSRAAAARRGYDLSAIRARQIVRADLRRFDLLLGMEQEHVEALQRLGADGDCGRIRRFMEFADRPPTLDVPDPYYGGAAGFDQVLDLIESAAQGLIAHLRRELR